MFTIAGIRTPAHSHPVDSPQALQLRRNNLDRHNPTERGIRGPVVGRPNHFGSKSRRGTEVASIFYALVETANLRGVNPRSFLRDAAMGVDVLAEDYQPSKPPIDPV